MLGYEVLLGGWENTRVTLSRGYAREPAYDARLDFSGRPPKIHSLESDRGGKQHGKSHEIDDSML